VPFKNAILQLSTPNTDSQTSQSPPLIFKFI